VLNPKLDFKASAFHCPHCGVYAKQQWYNMAKAAISEKGLDYYAGFVRGLYLSMCSKCGKYALWLNEKILYPALSIAPWPIEDMPVNVKEDFLEARSIVNTSPKAASALLRIGLQKLMCCLGESGKNMEIDVSNLIRRGLPERFRDALRAVRVIGANSIRPNEISPMDDLETATALFSLVNMIVEATISQQRKVTQLYTSLPNPKPSQKRQTRKKARKRKKSEVIPKPTILYR
jgi:hypothetical protein